ncbi:MAG: single-stranded-DNA-specific exonuclease RecJ [Magnetococcales bacterium]|nr:single-stranded-DNA-specific exonuclease RecJ [Magnetococcales bacterium]
MDSHLSFMGRRWQLRATATATHRQLAEKFALNPLFATILADRGLEDEAAVETFLQPRLQQLLDPLSLLDMDKAVERLIRAVEAGESIAVFGDYDVDGVTSSALLIRYFRALGIELRVYIPDRMTEGYGPNVQAMRILAQEGVRVVITVDCGATAFEALEAARQVGLEVIVTDHHQMRGALPAALAIINPNRPDETFPHNNMAGVGVAFYLLMALNRGLRQRHWFADGRPEPQLKQWLDLVAIGTIADVAGLTGLNRILVAHGLRGSSDPTQVGLQALKESARLTGTLRAGQVAFQLGPRINAGGRLNRGMLGVELLTTEDAERAQMLAEELEGYNRDRQLLEERMLRQALEQVANAGEAEQRFGWVVAAEGWHPGVIGVVASRLAERLYRPVIVIALDGQGKGKGSGRSIPGVNLLAAVEAAAPLLTAFGGHRAAAGLSLEVQNLEPFTDVFNRAIGEQLVPGLLDPVLHFDGALPLTAISRSLVGHFDRLHPFGQGNPEPVVVLENVRVVEARLLKDRHVKCFLADTQDNVLDAIAFQAWPGPLGEGLRSGVGRLDVAGTCSINSFRDRESVQMIIKDARPVQGSSRL